MRRPAFKGCAALGGGEPDVDPDLPSGRGFIALLEAFRGTGGTAPGDVVGCLLEEHGLGTPVSLARLIHSGQAFGFEWRASLWIPMFQFDADDLGLKAGAARVRAELPSTWSGWGTACWFATPNVRLAGHCPADLLDSDLDTVLAATSSAQAAAGFTRPRVRRAPQASLQS